MITRRDFLRTSAAVGIGFAGLRTLMSGDAWAKPSVGYGALMRGGILDLPKGFSFKVISKKGDEMDDGLVVPGQPDGMATFPGPDGTTILIRNHELEPNNRGPFGEGRKRLKKVPKKKIYDYGLGATPGAGGTTTVV